MRRVGILLIALASLALSGCHHHSPTVSEPRAGNCGGWQPLHLPATVSTPLQASDLTLCSSPNSTTMYVANSGDGIVWSVTAPLGVVADDRTDEDRFMVPLFEQTVGWQGLGVHLLEPGTSYRIETNYLQTRLATASSSVQVAWTAEKILYGAGINSLTGSLAGVAPSDTPRGRAVKACLTTAFQDGYQIASEPADQRIPDLENLWIQQGTLSCASQLYTTFNDPSGGLPDVNVSGPVIEEEGSGLRAFLEDAVKIAGEELPDLVR